MAGARLLADYLEYAGSGGTAAQAPGGAELDPFDADVRDRLAASGRAGHRHNGTRRAGHRPRSRHDQPARRGHQARPRHPWALAPKFTVTWLNPCERSMPFSMVLMFRSAPAAGW